MLQSFVCCSFVGEILLLRIAFGLKWTDDNGEYLAADRLDELRDQFPDKNESELKQMASDSLGGTHARLVTDLSKIPNGLLGF
jgi:hypothetical protein